jgi:CrcB protein
MFATILVFVGGGIGAVARHGVNLLAPRLFGMYFPWATIIENILGSFLIGLLAAFFAFKADATWSQHTRLFLTTGVLGGFTTFSAFSLDFALLYERGELLQAILYATSSVGISLAAIFLGLFIVRAIV